MGRIGLSTVVTLNLLVPLATESHPVIKPYRIRRLAATRVPAVLHRQQLLDA